VRWYDQAFVIALVVGGYVIAPVSLIWGWIRWIRSAKLWTLPSGFSLVGFSLSTISGLLFIASLIDARIVGGFPFYDPRLMRMIRWGMVLSIAAFLFAVCGVWRRSPLRWFSLWGSIGAFSLWGVVGEGE
jgi:hypothetical protein